MLGLNKRESSLQLLTWKKQLLLVTRRVHFLENVVLLGSKKQASRGGSTGESSSVGDFLHGHLGVPGS